MCFSAAGSFGAAALLASVGTVALVQEQPRAHRAISVIPILFAIQQAAEGVVWLTIGDPDRVQLHLIAVAAFLGFAVVIWPTWMPFALFAGEKRPGRRKVLGVLGAIGIGVSLFAISQMVRVLPPASIEGHSMTYSYAAAGGLTVFAVYLPIYAIAAVLPFFVASTSRAREMGGVLAMSLVVTFVIRRETLVSVWCFSAAILSGMIVLGNVAEQRLKRARRP